MSALAFDDTTLDEAMRRQLQREVESSLGHMVTDARKELNLANTAAQSDAERERAQQSYKDTMETLKMMATELYQSRVREALLEKQVCVLIQSDFGMK